MSGSGVLMPCGDLNLHFLCSFTQEPALSLNLGFNIHCFVRLRVC